MSLPRGLLVAAPRSGSGKTTFTLGLLRALRRRGVAVAGAKCGPDYIDPAFHAAATGRRSRSLNLDSWAMPSDLVVHLASCSAPDGGIVVCEGSMGLFDGVPAEPGRSGTSADIAAATGWPVVLVVDVSGQAQSAAAIVRGCAAHDARIAVAGVVLNRVASERHRRLVSGAIEALGMPLFGALPRADAMALPERHLGLVQARETADLDAVLDRLADFVEANVDVGAVMAVSGARAGMPSPGMGEEGRGERRHEAPAHEASVEPERRASALPLIRPLRGHLLPASGGRGSVAPPGQRIAIADDAAFTFLYPHLVERWRTAGAELQTFSPLADEPPPDGCDSCWLPGGYPELHAGRLAAAARFRAGLRRFADTRPVHGECGGYMVLGEALTDADGVRHAMTGLLGVETSFAKRKMNLGYREARLAADCALGPAGTVLRGHEFHYASIVDAGRDTPFAFVRDAYGGAEAPAGSRRGRVTGSFFHVIASV